MAACEQVGEARQVDDGGVHSAKAGGIIGREHALRGGIACLNGTPRLIKPHAGRQIVESIETQKCRQPDNKNQTDDQ